MQVPPGGIDIYYVDESTDRDFMVMTALAVPFVRQVDGIWTVVWEDHFRSVRDWRRRLRQNHQIPVAKELKGAKLLSGRGRYLLGRHQLRPAAAAVAYRAALSDLSFLQPHAIISVVGSPRSSLYGHGRLQAVLYALLQRMRTACSKNARLGLVFFDEGHGEYRKLYRKARVYMPTGSNKGDWGGGAASRNLPLDNFVKDANIKESEHSFFIQLADMLSFACLLKVRGEEGRMTIWQAGMSAHTLYDATPLGSLNTHTSATDPLGIVRLA
jgi:hypothetical protein